MSKSLEYIAGGAAAYLIAKKTIPSYDMSSKWKDVNVGLHIEEVIEKKYDIELISEEEGKNIRNGIPNKSLKQESKWNNNRVRILDEILPIFPKHFYERDERGNKLMIEMVESDNDFAGQCDCFIQERSEIVRIHFGSFFGDEAKRILAHELVHRITPFDGDFLRSPWFDNVDQVLGSTYKDERDRVDVKANHLLQQVKNSRRIGIEDYVANIRNIQYGFGLNPSSEPIAYSTPIELWPTVSEYYIQGKYEFMRQMGMLIDRDDVARMYDFTKDEIFKGKEYESIEFRVPQFP